MLQEEHQAKTSKNNIKTVIFDKNARYMASKFNIYFVQKFLQRQSIKKVVTDICAGTNL